MSDDPEKEPRFQPRLPDEGTPVRPRWRCFFCDEVFTTPGGAADHFGSTLGDKPGCLIDYQVQVELGVNTQRGRGLLMELRRTQDQLRELQRQVGEDDTPKDRELYRLQSEHQVALRREEEKGYERGLKDGLMEPLTGPDLYALGCDVGRAQGNASMREWGDLEERGRRSWDLLAEALNARSQP